MQRSETHKPNKLNSRQQKFVADLTMTSQLSGRTAKVEALTIAFLSAQRAGLLTMPTSARTPFTKKGQNVKFTPAKGAILFRQIADDPSIFNRLDDEQIKPVIDTLCRRHQNLTRQVIQISL